MKEKICSCALNRIFGFSPKIGTTLISHIGSAAEIFRMKSGDLDLLLGPHSKYRGMISPEAAGRAEKELEWLERMDVDFIGWNEDRYPALLHECEDAPVGLYVRSTTPMDELWAPRRRIAVIGTRDISPYGREWCARAVSGLATSPERPAIVSGLAIGTDFCAHRAALENGLPTIGVMATGPESIYPPRHREFAERMYHTKGCALITDYPPQTPPLAPHFLRRNRIIAGLSDSTILIESKLRGGGMMTSRLAHSYNREVYALPGRADDIRSQGCNYLIKNKIAEPITSVEDLLGGLEADAGRMNPAAAMEEKFRIAYRESLPPERLKVMGRILNLIRRDRGITIEELSCAAGITYKATLEMTGLLESDGFITVDLLQRCTINFR